MRSNQSQHTPRSLPTHRCKTPARCQTPRQGFPPCPWHIALRAHAAAADDDDDIGFGSTAVVTGDVTQIDLPGSEKSGLINASDVLDKLKGISFTRFSSKDVVRHPLVQKIVDAYAREFP